MPDPDNTSPWSLEKRISRRLLLVLGSLWLAGSLIALLGVWHETSQVLDSALQETAERFLFLPDIVVNDRQEQERFLTGISLHDEYVVYQVFDASGRMLLRSHDAPRVALDSARDDDLRDINGWRVLTRTRLDGERRVQVGETLKHRFEVLWGSLGWLFGTLFVVLPTASLALTVILRHGFRTLEPARAELARRKPDDGNAISDKSVPQELQPWIASVNEMIARDRVLIDAERSFAARTAHELRTPLAAARAQAQRLTEMTVEPHAHQNAQALVRQLDRLTRLATRLLQMARIESRASVRREPVDLVMVARIVVAEFPEALAKERLRLEVAGKPGGVVGDVDAIGIALRNLIDNALKHGGLESWVTVLVEPLSIFVINDGPGVPADTLEKLVRPFERGITAAEGSGLGLSITHAIAQQAGGALELYSPIAGNRGFAAVLRFD